MQLFMGVEHFGAHCINGKVERISVPPGFVSLSSFTLKRVRNDVETCRALANGSASEPEPTGMDVAATVVDAKASKSSLKSRPWILYDQTNHNQEESESEQPDMDLPPRTSLPKGVIRGCPDCSDCVKVTARWQPDNARTEFLEEAPVFHPTEEEFIDTVKYLARIRPRAEPYGICRIVPPPSWQPPCPIKEKHIWEGSKFITKIQRIDQSQNQYSKDKVAGSRETVSGKKRKRSEMGLGYLFDNGPGPGPKFSLDSFKKYADNFKRQYFCQSDMVADSDDNSTLSQKQRKGEPSLGSIEGEYRRIVECPTEEIEVLCGADIRTGFGSGFPVVTNSVKMSGNQDYLKSGWNLNNTPRLPGSLLCFESCDASVDLAPCLHIGMCFSSLHWKTEEHHLYSLSYLHFGDPKVRYAIPGRYTVKVEAAVIKQFPNLWAEQPGLRQKLIAQLSLSMLKSEGIPVYHCVQHQGEFVLVFPGAYHSGFDCGFNFVEAVNYAPIDWLPYGQNAVELYRGQRRKTLISNDKLLLGAAREAVRAQWEVSWLRNNTPENLAWKEVCEKDGILAKALKLRVEQETRRREYLCTNLQSRKMDKNFDATSKRECCICLDDLHLSAVYCACSANRYSCLLHAKQLCTCAWSDKIFLFRYDTGELNVLVDAVEKKLSAVYRWAKEDLGLSLHQKKHDDGPASSAEQSNGKTQRPKNAATSESIGRDSSSSTSIRAELKARLLKSASSKNPKANEENATSSTPVSSSTTEKIGIGRRVHRLLQREVVPEVYPDSTSSSSSSEYEETVDIESRLREKEPVVSKSVQDTKRLQHKKEDRDKDLPSKALESTSRNKSVMASYNKMSSNATASINLGSEKDKQSSLVSKSNVICLSDDD